MFSFPTLDSVFHSNNAFSPRVYVVSDSHYRQMQQDKIEKQIKALEARADVHRKYLETVEFSIQELKNDIRKLSDVEGAVVA